MGIFNKLAFWKKNDDLGLGDDFGADLGLDSMDQPKTPNLGFPNSRPGMQTGLDQNMNLGMPDDTGFGGLGSSRQQRSSSLEPPGQPAPMQQPFGMQPQQQPERDYRNNDKFEVVSAKLDSIRYTLDSINQRLANLERLAYSEDESKRRW
ncbi:hypothetical protein KY366_06645 [Candidatus Woesearchaeota archaeon]|nr:hypothetical protein [Candidatus Woesearchaeota archaeon]